MKFEAGETRECPGKPDLAVREPSPGDAARTVYLATSVTSTGTGRATVL